MELTPCGPFRLGEVLGHGGSHTVFLATRSGGSSNDPTGPFAVKKLTGGTRDAPVVSEHVEAFRREIRLMRRTNHPGLVKIIDHASAPSDEPYLVMELLAGLPLDRVIRRLSRADGHMPSALAAFIAREIGAALAYVHELADDQGRPLKTVHGCLRPKEVVVLRDGTIKLLPFGPGNTGAPPPMTPRRRRAPATYRAPEQILGRPIDARADLFSLGAILWELLVGPPLFSGSTEEEAVASVLTREIPRPSSLRKGIPARLDSIVMKALARDPRRRYPDAESMVAELGRGLRERDTLLGHASTMIVALTGAGKDDGSANEARTQLTADFFSTPTAVKSSPRTPAPAAHSTSTSTRLVDLQRPARASRPGTGSARARRPGSPPPTPAASRRKAPVGPELTAASGFIERSDARPPADPTIEMLPLVSVPVCLTPTENVQIPASPPGGPPRRETEVIMTPTRPSLARWYLKLGAAAVIGAVAVAVWHGRGPWRERAIAAPAAAMHGPEIMAIASPPPAKEADSVPPTAIDATVPGHLAEKGEPAQAEPTSTAQPGPASSATPTSRQRRSGTHHRRFSSHR